MTTTPRLSPPTRALLLLVAGLAPMLTAGPGRAASIEVRHGAVAAELALASQAGVEILQRGGNATDAAVAAALATGVLTPYPSGIGGGGFLVTWDAGRAKTGAIDFRETAPRGATESMFVRADGSVDAQASRTGGLAVAVPGEPRGFELALKRSGRLSFAEVVAPAIRLAREGFRIETHLARRIAEHRDRLAGDPGLARLLLHEDGTPKTAGEILKRPELAATLERMARVGIDDFYEGEIAADIVQAVADRRARDRAATGALPTSASPLDAKDLANYRPVERDALHVRYRGRDVYSMPPPSSGGGVMAEMLGVLAGWHFGQVPFQGATYAHGLAEAMKAAFADRAVYYGDPAFTKVPLAMLLSAQHTDAIRARIDWKRARPAAEWAVPAEAAHDAGTTHICVVDADGNAASLTTSVNSAFGAALSVPGRDIVLNDTMDDFSALPGKANSFGLVGTRANAIAPGKRPVSSMTPTIVVDDGRVALVAGGSGGPLILTATTQTVIGVIDFGLGAEAAVKAPRLHHQWMPDSLQIETGFPEATRRSLEHVGEHTTAMPAPAAVQAITVRGRGNDRMLEATSDSRKGGVPAGY